MPICQSVIKLVSLWFSHTDKLYMHINIFAEMNYKLLHCLAVNTSVNTHFSSLMKSEELIKVLLDEEEKVEEK